MIRTESQAFVAGWRHGRRYGHAESPADVLGRLPYLSWALVDAYLKGQDDGIRRDSWRLDQQRRAACHA